MKKIDGYPHNGYPTDMGTGTGQIFIQRVGYGGATTCTLPAPLTSLLPTHLTSVMSSNVCPYIMFKFGDLIEVLCLRIDLIRICNYCIY